MSQYYNRIMQLKGADEFINTVKRWEVLSNNIKISPPKATVLLPDMLWIAKSGVGKTNMLRLMSEYLASKGNLMDFYGDVKFFEFLLGYCRSSDAFTELQRLMDEVSNAAGFRSEFRGIISIDIGEWLGHYEEKHFIDFMEYISANNDKWLIVLSVYSLDEKKLHNLEAFLSMYLRLERITVNLPETADLFEYIEKNLSEYGLSLSEEGKKLLLTTVEALRHNKYFDGFKSIRLLCQEIAYTFFSKENIDSYILSAEDLKQFAADSDYVKRTVANLEKANKIGFIS